MKVTVNPKVQKILEIYGALSPEKKEALDKVIEAFAKESESETPEETAKAD